MLDLKQVRKSLIEGVAEAKVAKPSFSACESPYFSAVIEGECSLISTETAHKLIDEIKRLRTLVQTAYMEGWADCKVLSEKIQRQAAWEVSESRPLINPNI
jgi:hypothetical protein